MGDVVCDASERVREILRLGLAVVGGSGARKYGAASLEASMGGEALIILRRGLAVGGFVVRSRVTDEVDGVRDTVVRFGILLNADSIYETYVSKTSR